MVPAEENADGKNFAKKVEQENDGRPRKSRLICTTICLSSLENFRVNKFDTIIQHTYAKRNDEQN